MAYKTGPKSWPSTEITTKGHHAVGMCWEIPSSKVDKTYKVIMDPHGFTCDCPSFKRCKHIGEVEARLCR